MSKWRPPAHIRAVAIGLAWRGDDILLVEVTEADDRLRGYRPPGGGIEFGETADVALRREWVEELDTDIEILGPPVILENLYRMNGAKGHEIVFIFPIKILAERILAQNNHQIFEPSGDPDLAKWLPAERLRRQELTLLPRGLIKHLDQLTI